MVADVTRCGSIYLVTDEGEYAVDAPASADAYWNW